MKKREQTWKVAQSDDATIFHWKDAKIAAARKMKSGGRLIMKQNPQNGIK